MKLRRSQNNVLLLLVLFLGLASIGAEILCEVKGSCKQCTGEDSFHHYCKETNKKATFICNDGDRQYEEFRACAASPEVSSKHPPEAYFEPPPEHLSSTSTSVA
jgi:hypothetical protein